MNNSMCASIAWHWHAIGKAERHVDCALRQLRKHGDGELLILPASVDIPALTAWHAWNASLSSTAWFHASSLCRLTTFPSLNFTTIW